MIFNKFLPTTGKSRSIDVPKFWSALQGLTGRGKESGRITAKGRNLSLNAVDGFHRFLWFVDTDIFWWIFIVWPILLCLIHIFLKWLALETPSIVMNGCKSAYFLKEFSNSSLHATHLRTPWRSQGMECHEHENGLGKGSRWSNFPGCFQVFYFGMFFL